MTMTRSFGYAAFIFPRRVHPVAIRNTPLRVVQEQGMATVSPCQVLFVE